MEKYQAFAFTDDGPQADLYVLPSARQREESGVLTGS